MKKGRRAGRAQPSRIWIALGAVALLVLVGALVLLRDPEPGPGGARVLTPVTEFGDVHGLAVDPQDPRVLYVATHRGLVMGNGTGWWRVGEAQDDYMGFTMHPTDPDTFWTSGHPRRGGNLGVQQSTDGGTTWRVLALGGTADFHAMAVSPVDPQALWGHYRGQLYASSDGGAGWAVVDADPPQFFALAGDPEDAGTVWGAGPAGVSKSTDGGRTWRAVTSTAFQGVAVARDGSALYAVGQGGGAKSTDGGATWAAMPLPVQGTPGHVAVDPADPDTVYVATYQAAIHESEDGGATWRLVKPAT